jgi:hypothetical protein
MARKTSKQGELLESSSLMGDRSAESASDRAASKASRSAATGDSSNEKGVNGKAVNGKHEVAAPQPFVRDAADLHSFLLNLRDRMSDETVAPIFALSALNQILNQPDIYKLMKQDSKELARDIWLRLKQAGLHVNAPVLLFEPEEIA